MPQCFCMNRNRARAHLQTALLLNITSLNAYNMLNWLKMKHRLETLKHVLQTETHNTPVCSLIFFSRLKITRVLCDGDEFVFGNSSWIIEIVWHRQLWLALMWLWTVWRISAVRCHAVRNICQCCKTHRAAIWTAVIRPGCLVLVWISNISQQRSLTWWDVTIWNASYLVVAFVCTN